MTSEVLRIAERPSPREALTSAAAAFAALAGAITIARIIALHFNPIDLYFDEAQYWTWSRTLDWGYFTKPPMVAWVIGATTALFGDAEWAVRLAAPIAHGLTATALFALARALYGPWAGFWAGVSWLVLPAVWFSSGLISTDALLLPFWAMSLLALQRLMATRAWIWAVLVGIGIGLGMQAKYAMLYFPLCAAIAALWLAPLRAALGGGRSVLIGAVALALIMPNVIWNAQNGFATVSHTADNVNLSADLFNLDELVEFITGQIMLVGPLLFLALLALFWRAARTPAKLSDHDKFLLAFIAPPLVVVTTLAFVTRANGNWAVVSYVAATAWIVGGLTRSVFGRRWLAAALALNVALGVAAMIVAFDLDLSSRFRGVRDARAWDETARAIANEAGTLGPLSAVMVDDRIAFYELIYYWSRDGRDRAVAPVRMWPLHAAARNAAELTAPMQPRDGRRVLVVHLSRDYHPLVAADFRRFRPLGEIAIPLGGGRARTMALSVGEDFAPVARDNAFRQRLQALRERR
jgi:hypothetical protein